MGMGIHKQTNGTISNGVVVHEKIVTPTSILPSLASIPKFIRLNWCRQFLDILKSALPLLAFLAIYGVNPKIRILPRFEDMNCMDLYNISAFEDRVLHFQPHKLVSAAHNTFLDFMSAGPYLMHYGLPVLYPLFLLLTGKQELVQKFYFLIGACMWFMFFIWKFMPTAPPWMYDNLELYSKSGTTPPPLNLMHREGCAFARLDKLTGIPFFFNMFVGNPVPFASFPSGHVTWPMCIYVITPPGGRLFALYILWVSWATLYSCHHYLSDAVAAVIMVIATQKLLNYLSEKLRQKSAPGCCSVPCCPSVVCSFNIV